MMMKVSVLASGSNGNSCLVEHKGTAVLVDAGKSGRELEKRMNALGKSLDNVNGVLITHAHSDHIMGAGVISRRHNLPLFMTRDVYEDAKHRIGNASVKHFSADKSFRINGLSVQPIPTSHSVCSTGYVFDRFGIFTDTGIVTKEMDAVLPKLKGVLLESNHDVDMLINGPYPYYLKQWILSNEGHLSNIHACEFVQERGKNLSMVLLGHLSGHNNTAEVAEATFESLVKRKIEFKACSRDGVSGSWRV
jgi:phosphoribosyl 1,2-cyclic phosphodiesterase